MKNENKDTVELISNTNILSEAAVKMISAAAPVALKQVRPTVEPATLFSMIATEVILRYCHHHHCSV